MRLKRVYETIRSPLHGKKYRRYRGKILVDNTKHKLPTIKEDWYEQLCLDLVQARQSLGLTQKALAKEIGSTQSWISDFENGKANPQLSWLLKLTKSLKQKITIQVKNS